MRARPLQGKQGKSRHAAGTNSVRSSGAVRPRDGHLQRYFLQKDLATNSSPWCINKTVSEFGLFHKPCTVLGLCLPACLPLCPSTVSLEWQDGPPNCYDGYR